MVDPDVMYRQAVAAYKAGRQDEARNLLLEIVGEHEHHEQSWLLLSGLVDTLEEQQICLENVVALNPANDRARTGLETVNQKIAARDKQAPGFSAPASPPSPIGAEFAPTVGDDLFGNAPWTSSSPQPQQQPSGGSDSPFDDWQPFNSNAPSPDPFGAPSTSVDWGQSDGPAAHGSGKQVELPSNQEYDDWVQGLNLSGPPAARGQDSPPPFQDEAPFGDTSFMIEPDTNSFLTNQPPATSEADPFGRSELFADDSNPWELDSAPFSDEPVEPYPTSSPPFSSPVSAFESPAFEPSVGFGDSDSFGSDTGSGPFIFEEKPSRGTSQFDFDAPDEDDDDLWPDSGSVIPQQTAVPAFASKQGSINVQADAYFRYIPDEIEPNVGGIDRRSLLILAGIAVLIILNMISFGALLM